MFSFYCKACDQEVDSGACRLADIIETTGGRLYVFECCDCGEVSSSELLQEYQYDLER
jgi:translation initiation factor 2 beta subunit (eIF-2beta)/eIF-5